MGLLNKLVACTFAGLLAAGAAVADDKKDASGSSMSKNGHHEMVKNMSEEDRQAMRKMMDERREMMKKMNEEDRQAMRKMMDERREMMKSMSEEDRQVMRKWMMDRHEMMKKVSEEDRQAKRKGWNKAVKYAYGWAKDEPEEEEE